MTDKKWVSYSGYAGLMSEPRAGARKIRDLNPNSVVTFTGNTSGEYVSILSGDVDGWVLASKVEDYEENFDIDCVDISNIQTPEKNDAQQYILWKSRRQVNMCGELSVCRITGERLSDLLIKWEQKDVGFFRRVFNSNTSSVASGTSDGDLVRMLNLIPTNKTPETLSAFKSYTPGLLDQELTGAIVSVRIDKITGRLNGSGILHWVVVAGVMNERCGYGSVYLYNPFPNRVEVYSYREFLASARIPYGARLE